VTDKPSRLLTTAEVAIMLRVGPRTVTRWAIDKRISSTRTPGGHRRYSEDEILDLAANGFAPETGDAGTGQAS
jgi:excisionase family DNA binding protein